MAVSSGTTVLLKIGAATLTGLVNNTFDDEVDEIDVTTKDSTGAQKEFIAGEIGSRFSAEGKYDQSTSAATGHRLLRTTMKARAAVAFIYGPTADNAHVISGNCIIVGLSTADPKNAERTWSATFRVTGATTDGTVASS